MQSVKIFGLSWGCCSHSVVLLSPLPSPPPQRDPDGVSGVGKHWEKGGVHPVHGPKAFLMCLILLGLWPLSSCYSLLLCQKRGHLLVDVLVKTNPR